MSASTNNAAEIDWTANPWDAAPAPKATEPSPPPRRRGRPPGNGKYNSQPIIKPVVKAPPPEEVEDNDDEDDGAEEVPEDSAIEEDLTRANFGAYLEQTLINNAPQLIQTVYPAMIELLKKNDKKAIELTLTMLGLVKAPSGINIVQNIANVGAGGLPSDNNGGSAPRGFESIIRTLEQADRLSLPAASSRPLPDFSRTSRPITIDADPAE